MQAFDRRLTLSQKKNLQITLVEDPFSMYPKEVTIQLQLEVIELQVSSMCKTKRRESNLLDVYRSLTVINIKTWSKLQRKR